MNKRTLLSLFLIFAMLFSLTACGQKGNSSAEGDGSGSAVSSVDVPEEPQPDEEETLAPFALGYYRGVGINPYYCDSSQNQTLVGLVYEPLFEVDETFQAHPCLAESVSTETREATVTAIPEEEEPEEKADGEQEEEKESSDKKEEPQTYSGYITDITIKLRNDVTFSDGSKMDADDVVYSLEQASAEDSIYYSRLAGVTSISQGSSSTVNLSIQGANTNVESILDIPIVKSGTGEDLFPVGTGPYIPKRDKNGLPKRLIANESWWQLGREYEEEVLDPNSTAESSGNTKIVTKTIRQPIKEIKIYPAEDSDELIFGFSSSNISMVSTDLTGVNSLQYTGRYTVTDYLTTNLLYLGCNTSEGACKETDLRSAVYRSLDRETIASRLLAGHGQGAAMPAAPNTALYDQELAKELEYDLQKAKELCSKANVGSTLTLIVNSDSSFKVAIAEEIGKELRSAGLSVEVQSLAWSDFRQALRKGEYDLYLGEVKLNANFDLSRLITPMGNLNYSGYENNNLVKKSIAFNCASKGERAKKASEFYTVLAEQAPIIPICFKEYSVLNKEGYLVSQSPTQQNLFYRFWSWGFTPEAVEGSQSS